MRKIYLIITLLIFASNAYPMDKRAPVNILPFGQQSIRVIAARTSSESNQYNQSGALISKAKNEVYGSKLIYRNTFMKDVELGVEVPYVFSRDTESKSASGAKKTTEIGEGVGDVAVALTYQIADFRTEPFGAIAGFEVKFPSGSAEYSRGTGAYDLVYRGSVSKKLGSFQPFVQAVYTDSLDGKVNGVEINSGDDLYMALGTKIMFKKLVRLEFKYFYDLATSESLRSSGDQAVKYEKYDLHGYRVKGELFTGKHLIWESFFESADPGKHHYYPGSTTITKDPLQRNRIGIGVTFIW